MEPEPAAVVKRILHFGRRPRPTQAARQHHSLSKLQPATKGTKRPALGGIDSACPVRLAPGWGKILCLRDKVPTVPILAWVWALAWRRQAERLANNPRLRGVMFVTKTVVKNGGTCIGTCGRL
jgi:hypothetical protein